ncbi:MAG TPA: hypothetical protein VN636_09180, partial [Acidimicrobiia bacterium]|nr:hypothetical protein [Acidimicrobiia bacterium]
DDAGNGCVDIVDATASTYTIVPADAGHTIRAVVTGTNGDGAGNGTSDATAVVDAVAPSNTVAPAISGTTTDGQQLTTTNGTWTGTPTITFTYQWKQCDGAGLNCTNINSATNSTYTLVSGDVGHTIKVVVTATNGGGDEAAVSGATVVVAAAAPANTVAPAISGTTTAGQQLTTTNGTWTGTAPITFHYQWKSCDNAGNNCADIGTDENTYTLTANEAGHKIKVTVTAHNTAGDTPATSTLTAAVAPATVAPANSVRPSITGPAVEQRTLTAHKGTWTGTPAPVFTYQWQRCTSKGASCANIAGATKTAYVLAIADVDRTIRVVVTATNAAGHSSVPSAVTVVIATVPRSINGPYFYDGARVRRAAAGVVGATTHGATTWTATAKGIVSPRTYGDLHALPHLAKPVIGIVATPSGHGYWMFAADGGVFSFGDARFYGSTGNLRLAAPIVAMAATPTAKGYWLFAADGGVFSYGDARFYGSTANLHLRRPVVAMLATPTGRGYWLVTSNGGVYRFGDAGNIGSVANLGRNDIVGLVSTGAGYRFVTKSLQLLTGH